MKAHWTKNIFKSREAQSKPWRKLGIHHMTWAAMKRQSFNVTLILFEAAEEADLPPVVMRTPPYVECVPYGVIQKRLARSGKFWRNHLERTVA